jgi:hypothetical protein
VPWERRYSTAFGVRIGASLFGIQCRDGKRAQRKGSDGCFAILRELGAISPAAIGV